MFRALRVDRPADGFSCKIVEVTDDDLPEGDVLVDVGYSTVNFKDGLAVTDSSPIVRNFPMVPGIDLAGTVAASTTVEKNGAHSRERPISSRTTISST